MPWRSVAVELGQPEQAPRMCRIDDAVAEAVEGDVAAVLATAGRTRVSSSSLMVATVSSSFGS